MNVIQKSLKWATWHPGHVVAGILIAIQIWWLELAPPGGRSEQVGAILLLALFLVFFIPALRTKHAIIRIPAVALAISFLGLHVIFDISYLPSMQTAAWFHGTIYVVTDNPEFLGWGIPYHQFVEWKNPLHYEIHDLGYHGTEYEISYDAKNRVVNLVDSKLNDMLLYSDDGTFRRYQGYVQVGGSRYYASEEYGSPDSAGYVSVTYTLFRCKLDNTSCEVLPMIYQSQDGYVTLRFNELSGDVDFYLEPDSATTPNDILIYSYGKEPRCHVAGCTIRP